MLGAGAKLVVEGSECLRPAHFSSVVQMSGYRAAASDSGDDRFKALGFSTARGAMCAELGRIRQSHPPPQPFQLADGGEESSCQRIV
jgi:hypothetical protein